MAHESDRIRERISRERGPAFVRGGQRVAMVYPSPYRVGMSSLGFQWVLSLLRDAGISAERAFLRELSVRLTDPVAVHGSFESDELVLEAMLGDEISGAMLRDDLDGDPTEEGDLGIRLAKLFVADGARDYLAGYK